MVGGRRLSPPGRDMRPMPPMRADHYPPAYPDRERIKREYRKPSPEMHRRSRSMTPPMKRRHPPSPGGYRAASPGMRRRRSLTPPPPPSLRRSRSRSPPRKPRAPSPPSRGSHRMGSDSRDSRRSVERHPGDFYGPWGTKIAIHDLKKITVDIKRNLPKGKRSTSPIIRRIINADDITLYRRNGEGARPLLERPELRAAVNRRFDDAPPPPPPAPAPNEPRVVAIIREPGQAGPTVDRHADRAFEHHRSRSRDPNYAPPVERQMPVGDRIDRDRAERTQRQVEKLEQMEVAIDRKLEQIQRYERKYEETMRDEKYGDIKDERKLVDRNIRDRLGPKRSRDEFEPEEDHQPRLPDFSQRPNKPPIWEGDNMRRDYYSHEHRDGFRSRGRGFVRGRGRARGRGEYDF
ncbi:serine/arginine repetitive matrix protein 1-like isoform X2 [Amphibalanus amphitrite]|uniref:serine/arginine repetitive matrix protein 1-like isoform X2 n=1 Tax=Amphibalanus amphitrite TaxID=1232801 RepID=UPI001C9063E8|nr:serine/arginine repetitive matrix protein 1-like isoform X2 [Amphibalanus amphitrite]XP_043204153.1 serine/arginine repetitive matrix protein 1-like isoform X2 [Amphibalanus amphitrite]XP_043204155.1 serine/arginine repetitive matrix protein 1-like isoform X2 [Amphibalanus amphitrite]XP_043204156.1 serine/arginine repetitive matrix protein 1-like isoform X2 [Amphibalanus amphitrite]XP_043204157.1 serine/arginine repetitive matrix protein 1-like isoform X2 [Amphibalanus amphitrite]XP_0432041